MYHLQLIPTNGLEFPHLGMRIVLMARKGAL